MHVLDSYSNDMERLVLKACNSYPELPDSSLVQAALDGQISKVLRDKVPISELREAGAFFTNHKLAHQLLKFVASEIEQGATILDPACGVGDLLLAGASYFPVKKNLETTLREWSGRIQGSDLYPYFIKLAKARLVLLAIHRGAKPSAPMQSLSGFFPGIRVADSLTSSRKTAAQCILINPPYTMTSAPNDCSWARGSVSKAALFIERYLSEMPDGTRIAAILPDVLRTGSRYLKWRQIIEQHARIESLKIIGRFDDATDIDVFVVRLTKAQNNGRTHRLWWTTVGRSNGATKRLADYFEIHVGSVVPHRDPLDGPRCSFIDAHDLPRWSTVHRIYRSRCFAGTTFTPPFVVVRRTSRPGDPYRAVGTIIAGRREVAVENHLIVLKPKSGSITMCRHLLANLRDPRTNDWLNKRIRCRHLTVPSLSEVPWWKP